MPTDIRRKSSGRGALVDSPLPISTPDDPVPKFRGERNQVVFIEKTLARFEAELVIGIESLQGVAATLRGLGPSLDPKTHAPLNREAALIGRCERAIELLAESARALQGRPAGE